MWSRALGALALAIFAAVLTASAVPGVYIIDEDNYLVSVTGARQGAVTVPGTAGLPPSPELLWFDPAPRSRRVSATPVTATAPPLYGLVALPFAKLGWRGFVALQAISFAATIALVALLARRVTRTRVGPLVAALTYAFASYGIEYAQGLWPHALATGLVTLSLLLALTAADRWATTERDRQAAPGVWDRAAWGLAFAAGAAGGIAAGLRYQDLLLVVAGGVAGCLLRPGEPSPAPASGRARRMLLLVPLLAGLSLPLLASSLVNHARYGSYNPISKGPSYLSLGEPTQSGGIVGEALSASFTNVVDYSTHPRFPSSSLHEVGVAMKPDPSTGAWIVGGAVKKAWLQSCPWVAVALVALAMAWRRRAEAATLRAASIVVATTLAAVAAYGYRRSDGFCANQRYLLELMPLASVALAQGVEPLIEQGGTKRALGWAAGGGALGALFAWIVASSDGGPSYPTDLEQRALLYVPLALAAVTLAAWAVARRGTSRPVVRLAATALIGASIGWAAGVHLLDDLWASRALREKHALKVAAIEAALPRDAGPIAVFAYWGNKDALGPLLLGRDVVILDPWIDRGTDAPAMVDALLEAGRRVFVVGPMPRTMVDAMADGRQKSVLGDPPVLIELYGK